MIGCADSYLTRAASAPAAAAGPKGPRPGDPLCLLPGDRFDDFEIISVLGRGGFGIVHLTQQVSLGRLNATALLQVERVGAVLEDDSLPSVDLAGLKSIRVTQV